ncbi:MAG TPA: SAM-dependent methyltransferase [Ferruginibacter sp.]|nr:SAM-dependent methyltransferase [Ferruginibacter sp.]HMP22260.1 SAM-dependent methyltransferase [Ferruginibacter sp.]
MPYTVSNFCQQVFNSANTGELVKLSLGGKRKKADDLQNVFVRPVLIKNKPQLSFIYRYSHNDITKNHDYSTAIARIQELLQNSFYNADLYSLTGNWHLQQQENGNIKTRQTAATLNQKPASLQHDKLKKRLIESEAPYLHLLGITTADGHVKKDMQDKYRQINHFTEIFAGILKNLTLSNDCSIVDMGSGKGYLTFALYDYLTNTLQKTPTITGIELRDNLVALCNDIAQQCQYSHLRFVSGSIINSTLTHTDILIALHACDTATDDAIYKGIAANASVIVCAPCCHKQIRKEMNPANALQLVTQHGILLERQAEMVTDTIRALILEAFGYKTSIFEFIATEHTPKNVLIAATKRKTIAPGTKEKKLNEIEQLKKLFGINTHYLEQIMGSYINPASPANTPGTI